MDSGKKVTINQYVFDKALEQTVVGTGSDPFQRYLLTVPDKWNIDKFKEEYFTQWVHGIPIPRWVTRSDWIKMYEQFSSPRLTYERLQSNNNSGLDTAATSSTRSKSDAR